MNLTIFFLLTATTTITMMVRCQRVSKIDGGAIVVPLNSKSFFKLDDWTLYFPLDRLALIQISEINDDILSRTRHNTEEGGGGMNNSKRLLVKNIKFRTCIEGLRRGIPDYDSKRRRRPRSSSSSIDDYTKNGGDYQSLTKLMGVPPMSNYTVIDADGNFHDLINRKSIITYGLSEINDFLMRTKIWSSMSNAEIIEKQLLFETELTKQMTFCESIELSRLLSKRKYYNYRINYNGFVNADRLKKIIDDHLPIDDKTYTTIRDLDKLFKDSRFVFNFNYKLMYFTAKVSLYGREEHQTYRIIPMIQSFRNSNKKKKNASCIYAPMIPQLYTINQDGKIQGVISCNDGGNNGESLCLFDDSPVSNCLRRSIEEQTSYCSAYMIECPDRFNERIDRRLIYEYVNRPMSLYDERYSGEVNITEAGSFVVVTSETDDDNVDGVPWLIWFAPNATVNDQPIRFDDSNFYKSLTADSISYIPEIFTENSTERHQRLILCITIIGVSAIVVLIYKRRRELYNWIRKCC